MDPPNPLHPPSSTPSSASPSYSANSEPTRLPSLFLDFFASLSSLLSAHNITCLLLSGDKRLATKLYNGVREFQLNFYPNYKHFPAFISQLSNLHILDITVPGDYYFGDEIGTGALLHMPASLTSLRVRGNPVFQLTSKRGFLARLPRNLTELDLPCAIIKHCDLEMLPRSLTKLHVRYLDGAGQKHVLPPNLTSLSFGGASAGAKVEYPESLRVVEFYASQEGFSLQLPKQLETIKGIFPAYGQDFAPFFDKYPNLRNFSMKGYQEVSSFTVASLPRHLTHLEISGAILNISLQTINALPPGLLRFEIQTYTATPVVFTSNMVSALPPTLTELKGRSIDLESPVVLPPAMKYLTVRHFSTYKDVVNLPKTITHLEMATTTTAITGNAGFGASAKKISFPPHLTHLKLTVRPSAATYFEEAFPSSLTDLAIEGSCADGEWMDWIRKIKNPRVLRALSLSNTVEGNKKAIPGVQILLYLKEFEARQKKATASSCTLSDYDLFLKKIKFEPIHPRDISALIPLLPRQLEDFSTLEAKAPGNEGDYDGLSSQEFQQAIYSSPDLPSSLSHLSPLPPLRLLSTVAPTIPRRLLTSRPYSRGSKDDFSGFLQAQKFHDFSPSSSTEASSSSSSASASTSSAPK